MKKLLCLFVLCLLVASSFALPQVTTDAITIYAAGSNNYYQFNTDVAATSNFDVTSNGAAVANNGVVCTGETVTVDSRISATFSSPDYQVYSINPRLCEDTYQNFNGQAPQNVPVSLDAASYDIFYNTNARYGTFSECYSESDCWGREGNLRSMPVEYYGNQEDRALHLGDNPSYPNTRASVAMVCSLQGSSVDIVDTQTGRSILAGGAVRNTGSVSRSVTIDNPGTYRVTQDYAIPGCAGIVRHPSCGTPRVDVETAYTRDAASLQYNTNPVPVDVPARTVNIRVLGREESGFLGSSQNAPNDVTIQRWGKGYVNFVIRNTGAVPFHVPSASLQGSNGFSLAAFNMQATCNALRQDGLDIQNCGYNSQTCATLGFTNSQECDAFNSNGFDVVIQPNQSRMLVIEVTPVDNIESGRDYAFSIGFDKVLDADSCDAGARNSAVPVSLDYVAQELSASATCSVTPSPFATHLNEVNDATITCRNTLNQQIDCGNGVTARLSAGTRGVAGVPRRAQGNNFIRVSSILVTQLGNFPSIQVSVDGGPAIGTYACSAPIELGNAPNQNDVQCVIGAQGPNGLDVQRDGLAPGMRATFYASCVNARGERVDDCPLTWSSSNLNILRPQDAAVSSTKIFTAQNQEGVATVRASGVDPDTGAFDCTPLDVNVNSQNGREESCELLPPVANIPLPAANQQYSQDYSINCYDAGGNFVPCLQLAWSSQLNSGVPPANLARLANGVRVTGNAETSSEIIANERNANLGVDVATCNAQLQVVSQDVCGVRDLVCNMKDCPQDPDCPCPLDDGVCNPRFVCFNAQGVRVQDPDCQTCSSVSVIPEGGVVSFGQLATYSARCGVWPFEVACQNPVWNVQMDNPQSVAAQNTVANRLIVRAGQVPGEGTVSAMVDGFACRNTQPLVVQPACGPLDGICPAGCDFQRDDDCAPNDECAPGEVFFEGECLQDCPGGFSPEAGICVPVNDQCAPDEVFVNGQCVPNCAPGSPGCRNNDDDPSVCKNLIMSSNQVQPGDHVRITAICGGGGLCDNPRVDNIEPDNFNLVSRPGANPIEIVAGQSIGSSAIRVRVGRSVCPVQPQVTVLPFVCRDFT